MTFFWTSPLPHPIPQLSAPKTEIRIEKVYSTAAKGHVVVVAAAVVVTSPL